MVWFCDRMLNAVAKCLSALLFVFVVAVIIIIMSAVAVTLPVGAKNLFGSAVVRKFVSLYSCCEMFMLRSKVRILVRFRVTQP